MFYFVVIKCLFFFTFGYLNLNFFIMKQFYFLFVLLSISFSFSQGNETFEGFTETGSSYSDGTFTGQDGSTWTYVQARGDQSITGKSIMLGRNRSPQAEVYSGTISGGVGTISFNYQQAFSTSVNLNILVNDVVYGTVTSTDQSVQNSGPITVNQPGDVVIKFISVNNSDGQVTIDDVTWTSFTGSATPTISVSGSVSGLDYFEGNGPSAEDSFTVGGINLTDDITVTAPTNFEVSLTSGSGFGSSVVVAQSGGTAPNTTIYVRLAAGLSATTYNGDVTASSTGAADETVALSGTVSPATPQFSVFGAPVDPLNYSFNNGPSNEDAIFVEGLFLTSDITVTAPANFEVSLTSGNGFASSVSVSPTGGTVANTEVFVRLAAGLSVNSYSGDITVSSSPAADQTVAVTGNVFGAATNALVIVGAYDGPLTGGIPKGIELYALADIPDLSVFGISSVSTADGSSAGTIEYNFPSDAVSQGDRIYLATESTGFNSFFGFAPTYTDNVVNINGDDSIELYEGTTIIDTFGDVDTDGTGEPWEYLDGWAYRKDGTGPDGSFVLNNWTFSGPNALDGETSNGTAETPYPIGTYSETPNTDPTLVMIDGPEDGETVTTDPELPNNADIAFTTTNFVMSNETSPGSGVSDGSGDGFIIWSVENTNGNVFTDGGSIFVSNDPASTYSVQGLAAGETYLLEAELVDNSGASFSPAVTYSFTFIIATYTDVSDLGTLRTQTVGPDIYYRVTGTVVNTHTEETASNTIMFFQDGTGAIKVYDDEDILDAYNTGDNISNIRGSIDTQNGVLTLYPSTSSWGAATPGSAPTPAVVTISTLNNNLDTYESQLVQINAATFADAGGTFVAAIGGTGNYDITDASGTMTFRTDFGTANYIGQTIPSGAQDLVVIVSRFFTTPQVVARSLSDFTLDNETFELGTFNLYPNPTNTGYVTISSTQNKPIKAQVFNVIGKQVLQQTLTNNRLNVSSLNTGVYLVKLTQDNASVTKKLVIR